MDAIEIIRHSEATSENIDRAINLKQKAWSYPKESQIKWIQDNLREEDYHVFLLRDGHDVAYLNMVSVNCIINGASMQCVGIGNVCSSVTGGGKALLSCVNTYLLNNKLTGLLFCRDTVVGFYKKCNWKLISPEQVTLRDFPPDINTMVYGIHDVKTIEYHDRNF